jgi:nucleoside-diphosphate-sugar epimerase
MKVLVTGAAGFLGQHICSALTEAGHPVTGLDELPPIDEDCAQWISADITQPLLPAGVPTFGGELDAVIHLAAIAAPRTCDVQRECERNLPGLETGR